MLSSLRFVFKEKKEEDMKESELKLKIKELEDKIEKEYLELVSV